MFICCLFLFTVSALHDVDKQSVKQKSDVKTRQFLPGIHGYPQTGLGTGYDPSAMGHGYDPSGMATGYDHSAMGHGYDPSAMGHDYDPSGMATGYDHSAMGHGYDPSAMGHGYDPSGMATGYDPSGMATGYDPSAMGHGYDPSAMGTGYDHSGMGSGYDPSGMGTGYDPSGMGHDTGFPVAPAAMYDHKNFMTREEVIDFFYGNLGIFCFCTKIETGKYLKSFAKLKCMAISRYCFAIYTKGNNFFLSSYSLPRASKPYQISSTFKGKNLLLVEQILSFKS